MYYKVNFDMPKTTNNGWLQINNIKFYTSTGTSKTPAELAFPQAEYSANYGQAFESPIATAVSDGAITYASDNEAVAKVDANTGIVTIVGEGSTKITATIAETDEYAAGTASYTLTVADNRTTSTLAFPQAEYTVNLGEEFTAPEFSEKVGDGEISFASDNEKVATVDAATGAVTLGIAGKATITASIAATATYKAAAASYTIKVVDPNAPKFELVTDVANLKNGTKIIIVNTANGKALGTTQNSNNRSAVDVEIIDNQIEPDAKVQIIELQKDGNNFALHVNSGSEDEGYLTAVTGSSNYLRTQSTITWASISISSGDATIKFNGSYTKNLIKYNSSSTIFSCYSSGQNAVQIYALPNTYKVDGVIEVSPVDYVVNGNVIGQANLLCVKPTIIVNGNPESDLAGYEIYLDDTKIGNANDDAISGFAYTSANQKFTLHDGGNVIPFEVNGLTFETEPMIEGVEYLDETDEAGETAHHAVFYVKPQSASSSLNWVVTAPETENAPHAIYWRNNANNFTGAACHFYNVGENAENAPESIDVRISYPIAVNAAQAQGIRLMADGDSEYTYEMYHTAAATLPTSGFEKNEDNTSTSGVADVAVDQTGEAEFFNLQGVRVQGELVPGLYIRRQGNTAVKVMIK